MMKKITVLTFAGHYLPGIRAGGPIRSIASLVSALGDELDFKIIAFDRDIGSSIPYAGIQANIWQRVGKADVYYVAPKKINWIFLSRIITSTPHNILYLNSFFNPRLTILPLVMRRCGLLPNTTTIVAPRGELSIGALNLKSLKKRVYIWLAKLCGFYNDVVWQVSSTYEKEDVYRIFKNFRREYSQSPIVIAPNMPYIKSFKNAKSTTKEPGSIKIVFLSRISPMKNLKDALKCLTSLRGRILFNIFGPIEDVIYWESCRRIIEKLPTNIQAHYQGMVDRDEVMHVMAEHDLFFLPTRGENFGHVIIEALAAGCPILISDQTPWRDLEKEGVGWAIPLNQQERFTAVLQQCVDMGNYELANYSNRAQEYAKKKMLNENTVKQNRDLFATIQQKT